MLKQIRRFREHYNDVAYLIFRILIGLFFMLHGIQKVFGLAGKSPTQLTSLIGLAGIIELIAGIFVVIGLFTSLAAFVAALEMLVAYLYAHAPQGVIPLANGGELALLYFAAFLYIIFEGGGRYSLDRKLFSSRR